MRNPQGYSVIFSPGERDIEHDTFSCAHCGGVTFTKGMWGNLQVAVIKGDGQTVMYDVKKCFSCDEYICPKKACQEKCIPKLKRIEQEEKEARKIILAGA